MAQLVDTSVFVQLERERITPRDIAGFMPSEPIALAAITASELLSGVHAANTRERRVRREAFVEFILATVPVVPFDLQVARTHALLAADLRASGRTIGAHDLQIAATAVSYGWGVVTTNVRDFVLVSGLKITAFPARET
jgi:tRNA(fMet)-specific endonuclease VapC